MQDSGGRKSRGNSLLNARPTVSGNIAARRLDAEVVGEKDEVWSAAV